MGSLIKSKVREMEDNKKERITRRTRKEVVGYVHDMVGKKKFLIQFENGQKKEMISCSLVFLCLKKEV